MRTSFGSKYNSCFMNPVDSPSRLGLMMEESTSDGRNGANAAFSGTVRVVSADSRVCDVLMEAFQMRGIFGIAEGGAIVCNVGLDDDAISSKESFKDFLSSKGFIRIEMNLMMKVFEVGGVVNKDTATGIPIFF